MDQIAMLQTPEEEAYQMLLPYLRETLRQNYLDESCLAFEQRKNYYSIIFNKNSVVAQLVSSPSAAVLFPSSALYATGNYSSWVENDKAYSKISLIQLSDVETYVYALQGVLDVIINRLPTEFGCCSKYMECSDAMRCLKPEYVSNLQCFYRKVLRSGKVFYGKNRNID